MIRIYKNLSTKLSNMVNKLKTPFAFFIFLIKKAYYGRARHCMLCDEHLYREVYVCQGCAADLPRLRVACAICCLPLEVQHHAGTANHLICGECLHIKPSFHASLCPFIYAFPIRQLIRGIKYSKKRHWATALSFELNKAYIEALASEQIKQPDLLIPIPIHKSKRKIRGYNQAELIGKYLSSSTGIPLNTTSLIKHQDTDTQAQLSKRERMQNLKGSFSISKKARDKQCISNKHIALIDDVITTKSTCELASRLLLQHGAKQVDIWCLARTPKHISI